MLEAVGLGTLRRALHCTSLHRTMRSSAAISSSSHSRSRRATANDDSSYSSLVINPSTVVSMRPNGCNTTAASSSTNHNLRNERVLTSSKTLNTGQLGTSHHSFNTANPQSTISCQQQSNSSAFSIPAPFKNAFQNAFPSKARAVKSSFHQPYIYAPPSHHHSKPSPNRYCSIRRLTYLFLFLGLIALILTFALWKQWTRQHDRFVKDQVWMNQQRDQIRAYCAELLRKNASYSEYLTSSPNKFGAYNCSFLSDRSFQAVLLDPSITDIGVFGERMRAFAAMFYGAESCDEDLYNNLLPGLVDLMFSWISPDFNTAMQFLNLEMSGKGIVICGGNHQMSSLQTVIYTLRYWFKTSLPIEIYFFGEEGLSQENRATLEGMADDVSTINLEPFYQLLNKNEDDEGLVVKSSWWSSKKSEFTISMMKPFAMLASRFAEIILLDADTGLLQSPNTLFDFTGYQQTGAYFFTDRYFGVGPLLDPSAILFQLNPRPNRRACERPVIVNSPGYEMDPGVVALDKNRHLVGLLTTCNLLREPQSTYTEKFMSGDKEVLWVGLETVLEPYSFTKFKPGALGLLHDGMLCGRMLHFDESGRPLWWKGGYYLYDRPKENSLSAVKKVSSVIPEESMPFLEAMFFDDGGLYNSETLVQWKEFSTQEEEQTCLIQQSARKRRLGALAFMGDSDVRQIVDRQVVLYQHFISQATKEIKSL